MAIQVAAILAVVAAVQQVARVKMITVFLENVSHRTVTKWDDILVDALCDVPPTEIPAKVEALQKKYDNLSEDEKVEVKIPIVVAWEEMPNAGVGNC